MGRDIVPSAGYSVQLCNTVDHDSVINGKERDSANNKILK